MDRSDLEEKYRIAFSHPSRVGSAKTFASAHCVTHSQTRVPTERPALPSSDSIRDSSNGDLFSISMATSAGSASRTSRTARNHNAKTCHSVYSSAASARILHGTFEASSRARISTRRRTRSAELPRCPTLGDMKLDIEHFHSAPKSQSRGLEAGSPISGSDFEVQHEMRQNEDGPQC